MLDKLIDIEKTILPALLSDSNIWETLDVDYFPPRVERVWTPVGENRLYVHVIHPTEEMCLFHKHRWPAAVRMLRGSYEMGVSYDEDELTSNEAHALPVLAKFILGPGSYYEMTDTHSLHYVKPLGTTSLSIMLTGPLYPEAVFRREALDRKLGSLTEQRKNDILRHALIHYNG